MDFPCTDLPRRGTHYDAGVTATGPFASGSPPPALDLKRVIDVTLASVLLACLSPLLFLVAIAVRMDSRGSALFRQRRIGLDQRPFTIVKFRSMVANAESEPHRQYIAKLAAEDAPGDDGELRKLTNDPRVTRVGAFIRRTSIDELPQLFNVLAGDMSLVGPRPAIDYELEFYRPYHFERFGVRPGMTGLWQISGRNQIGLMGMLDIDVEYARWHGILGDLLILIRTPGALARGRAA
jgi:lipopolysaccharide/colanic/teichoic acid biosynthesis glycosyltransferase